MGAHGNTIKGGEGNNNKENERIKVDRKRRKLTVKIDGNARRDGHCQVRVGGFAR